MRIIKFRGKRLNGNGWVHGYFYRSSDGEQCFIKHVDFSIIEDFEVIPESVGQFTGLHDKNGREIYEGDIMLCKIFMGENKEYFSHCYYSVSNISPSGFELIARKMTDENQKNNHPIVTRPSFGKNSLCYDYRNQNYINLAFEDCWGENSMGRKRWQENHYSNDIEIAGNITDNPELIKQEEN